MKAIIAAHAGLDINSKRSLGSSLSLRFTTESSLSLCLYTELLLYSSNMLSPPEQQHFLSAQSFTPSSVFELFTVSAKSAVQKN